MPLVYLLPYDLLIRCPTLRKLPRRMGALAECAEVIRGGVKEAFRIVVQRTIKEQGWGPMLDAVREMPCAEDFEPWDTNVRKDFLRKWYHTRSKRVYTVSLEECMEDEDSGIHAIPDPAGEFTARVEAEDFCQRFKASCDR